MASDLLDASLAMACPLRVLLVGGDECAALIEQRVRTSGDMTIRRASEVEAVEAEDHDVLVIGLDRPKRAVLHDLRRLCADHPRPVVMFIGCDDPVFMEEAIAAGVGSYNVVTAELPHIRPIVLAAVAVFRGQQRLAAELQQVKTSLKERETIDRAKALLIRERNLDEPTAYRWLRRKAMNESKRIAAVAAELLADGEPRS